MSVENFTLLYVEDDRNAQEWMKLVLEDDVKEFLQAYDGEEGLEMYKKYNPDIILSDVNMPKMDGLEMSAEIKKLDSDQHILIMSAFDDRDTLMKAINIGIDFFIPKPIDVEKLMLKLEKIAQNLQNRIDAHRLKEQEMKELYNLAHYDNLTRIPNRVLFDIRLDEAISKAKRKGGSFTVFFIDLDDFKNINDNYGHAAGDVILRTISENIKKVIRVEDTFARISGDEFSLIIEDIDDDIYIENLAKKILDAASTTIHYYGDEISITCSVGISRFPNDSDSKKELLFLADSAMYKAKKLGKARYFYVKEEK